MSEPIHLEVRQVALAAKRAFDEGRLSAQGPTPDCDYRDDSGLPCAIGAALTDEQAAQFSFCGPIASLVERGIVTTDSLDGLREIQSSHDGWASVVGEPREPVSKAEFLATLNSILGEA